MTCKEQHLNVQISSTRYKVKVVLDETDQLRATVTFDEPVRAVTPGQAVVFYA